MTAPEQPTPEAMEAAIDHIWPHYTDPVMPKTEYARRSRACIKLALCLDRFAAQRAAGAVERERDRCAQLARLCAAEMEEAQ